MLVTNLCQSPTPQRIFLPLFLVGFCREPEILWWTKDTGWLFLERVLCRFTSVTLRILHEDILVHPSPVRGPWSAPGGAQYKVTQETNINVFCQRWCRRRLVRRLRILIDEEECFLNIMKFIPSPGREGDWGRMSTTTRLGELVVPVTKIVKINRHGKIQVSSLP